MKRLLIAIALAGSLAACQIPPTNPTAPPTIDARIGTALKEVTITRQAFTALATAGKITWAQDVTAQSGLTVIRTQLDQAQTLAPTNPAQAAALLATALQALATYQGAHP